MKITLFNLAAVLSTVLAGAKMLSVTQITWLTVFSPVIIAVLIPIGLLVGVVIVGLTASLVSRARSR